MQDTKDVEVYKQNIIKVNIVGNTVRHIALLIVSANRTPKINFDFLDSFNLCRNNSNYKIHSREIHDTEFQSKLTTYANYLKNFDVVIIGSCDAYIAYAKALNNSVFDKLKQFHNEGGIIIFLHDVIYRLDANLFNTSLRPFGDLLGYRGEDEAASHFKEVKVNRNYHKLSEYGKILFSNPFYVDASFGVADTHQTPIYYPHYVVLSSNDGQNYFTQNIDEHLADCTMGHTTNLSETEKMFFYNVICNLFDYCQLNKQVKTRL